MSERKRSPSTIQRNDENEWKTFEAIGIVVQTVSSTELNEYEGDLVFITHEKNGWYRGALYKPTSSSNVNNNNNHHKNSFLIANSPPLPSSPTSTVTPLAFDSPNNNNNNNNNSSYATSPPPSSTLNHTAIDSPASVASPSASTTTTTTIEDVIATIRMSKLNNNNNGSFTLASSSNNILNNNNNNSSNNHQTTSGPTMGFIRSAHVFLLLDPSNNQKSSDKNSDDDDENEIALRVDDQLVQLRQFSSSSLLSQQHQQLDLFSETRFFKQKQRRQTQLLHSSPLSSPSSPSSSLSSSSLYLDDESGGETSMMFLEWKIPQITQVLDILQVEWKPVLRELIERESQEFEQLLCVLSQLFVHIRTYRHLFVQHHQHQSSIKVNSNVGVVVDDLNDEKIEKIEKMEENGEKWKRLLDECHENMILVLRRVASLVQEDVYLPPKLLKLTSSINNQRKNNENGENGNENGENDQNDDEKKRKKPENDECNVWSLLKNDAKQQRHNNDAAKNVKIDVSRHRKSRHSDEHDTLTNMNNYNNSHSSGSSTIGGSFRLNRLSQGLSRHSESHKSIRNLKDFIGSQLKLPTTGSFGSGNNIGGSSSSSGSGGGSSTNNNSGSSSVSNTVGSLLMYGSNSGYDATMDVSREFTNVIEGNHQMVVHVNPCIFTRQFNIDAEVHLSLYSLRSRQLVSERIIIVKSNQAQSEVHRVLIRDLDDNEFKGSLYLVARVYRVGPMFPNSGSSGGASSKQQQKQQDATATSMNLKRPYGCSVFELSPTVVSILMAGGRFSSDPLPMFVTSKEEDFANMYDAIINQKFVPYELAPVTELARGLIIGLRSQPGTYREVMKLKPEWSRVKTCHLLRFPSVISPGDMRNDIYITMSNATFKSSSKLKSVLVEAKVIFKPLSVSSEKLASIPCITNGVLTNSDSDVTNLFSAAIHYHVKTPVWNETFKINIAPEDLDKATVVFLFTDIGTKQTTRDAPFGISSWKVTEKNGSFNSMSDDGLYTMPIYKYSQQVEDTIYNFNPNDENVSKLLTKHTLSVKQTIVSTRVTKNEDIRNLLNWRTVSTPKKDILDKFLFCSMEQKVAMLREIFDAMFEILDHYDQREVSLLIYESIVEIICSLVSHNQFDHYKDVMDEYIREHFKSTLAQKWFIYFLVHYLNMMNDLKMANKVRENIKAMTYLFKFIVKSRKVYLASLKENEQPNDEILELETPLSYVPKHKRETNVSQGETTDLMATNNEQLTQSVIEDNNEDKTVIVDVNPKDEYQKRILYAVERLYELMNSQNNVHVGAQANLFKYAGGIFDSFVDLFDPEQLGYLTLIFLNEIPRSNNDKKSSINRYKINLIMKIVKSGVFSSIQPRTIVLPKVIEEVQYHIHESFAEKIDCVQIVKEIVNSINYSIVQHGYPAASQCIYTTFGILSDLEQAFNEMSATITELSQATDALRNGESIQDAEKTKNDILGLMLTFVNWYRSEEAIEDNFSQSEKEATGMSMTSIQLLVQMNKVLLQNHSFVKNSSISLKSLLYESVLQNMQNLAKVALRRSLISDRFDIQIWNSWFSVMFSFILADFIQVESFTRYRRLVNTMGDLRLSCATVTSQFWSELGDKRSSFIPLVIDSILKLFDLRNMDIHKCAVEFYFNVIRFEYQSSKSIQVCEDITQRCILERRVDDVFRHSFIHGLQNLFKTDNSMDSIATPFKSRLKSMLVDIIKVQQYDNNEDMKIHAIIQIMESLKESGNMELYLKYVHILSESHIKFGNWIEAALALKLHYDALSWDREMKLPYFSGKYPEETSFQRKEKIVKDMITMLSEGLDFERAIHYSKELRTTYEEYLMWAKIRDVMKSEGTFYTQIMKTERFVPRYFHVRYYGQGFKQMGLTDHAYIYRGKPLEKQNEFTDRLLKSYPGSVPLKEEPNAGDSMDNEPGMFIHVYIVLPVEDERLVSKFAKNKVHPNIAKYSLMSNISAVAILRRSKTEENGQYEMQKIHATLESELPGIKRSVRIVEQHVIATPR